MSKPVITVFISCYNQAGYLRKALDSACAQTFPRDLYEIIVINDGSIDGSGKILQDYRDRIKLIERANRGLVNSCNEGLALARGKYFIRLDSDDFVDADWLKQLAGALEGNPRAICAYSDHYEITGKRRRYIRVAANNLYSLIACGVLFYTKMLKESGGWRDFYWEEYDLYLRLREKGAFFHIPQPLYMYRRHFRNMTNDRDSRLQGWLQLLDEWGMEKIGSAGSDGDLDMATKMLTNARK